MTDEIDETISIGRGSFIGAATVVQAWARVVRMFAALLGAALISALPTAQARDEVTINMAVEFVDHAACAHIAQYHGWYRKAGLKIRTFDSYATGMALAAALSKGGIDAAYICLIPAITAYANARVPMKIVAGTHLYGYGLIVNPQKIKCIADLAKPEVRIGCTREGSPPALLLHRLVAMHHLDPAIAAGVRRMPPPKLLLALHTGRIDAAFMPEQYPSMGQAAGFRELVRASDVWPGMQGSVLVVRQALLDNHPQVVEKLVAITRRGIRFIHAQPQKASRIVSAALDRAGQKDAAPALVGRMPELAVTPAVIYASLTGKMTNTCHIEEDVVQALIDYAAELGYIKRAFAAHDILDLRYLHD